MDGGQSAKWTLRNVRCRLALHANQTCYVSQGCRQQSLEYGWWRTTQAVENPVQASTSSARKEVLDLLGRVNKTIAQPLVSVVLSHRQLRRLLPSRSGMFRIALMLRQVRKN